MMLRSQAWDANFICHRYTTHTSTLDRNLCMGEVTGVSCIFNLAKAGLISSRTASTARRGSMGEE